MLNEEKKESVICHDMDIMTCHDICHEVTNNTSNHDMIHSGDNFSENVNNTKLSKDEWFYLTQVLDSWRVYNARAVVKKNPALAWKIMTFCKDPSVRVKGAYFTASFRNELAKIEVEKAKALRTAEEEKAIEKKKAYIKALFAEGRQKLGIA